MTDGALASANSYAQVRVREPIGDRILGENPTIGGEGSDIVVPGVGPGIAVQIERLKGVWIFSPVGDARARFDGRPLSVARDVRRHDVLAIGDAQIIITDISRTLLRLDVCHLVGNATISPAGAVSLIEHGDGDEDLLIEVPRVATAAELQATTESTRTINPPRPPRPRAFWIRIAAVGVVALLFIGLISKLNSVTIDVDPEDARVRTPGTLVSVHAGGTLWLLPGSHVVRAERDGYLPAQVSIAVTNGSPAFARLRLGKLPGKLRINTSDVPAVVSIDGVETGRAPGTLSVPAGVHTVMLRAPRHVDYIASVDIQGAGASQELEAVLLPSWGTIQITAIPPGAHIAVDGVDSGVAPRVVDAPSGVRQIRISAPGLKTWESSVVLKAGESLNVGPVALGLPDAELTLTSVPSGAEVTVDGQHRGRTPLRLDLASAVEHELVVNSPGYATWTHKVFAEAAKKLAVAAKLEAVGARVTVEGEPSGAQLFIDGADRGHTPQSLELSAVEHRIEVRKQGWVPFTGAVTPSKGLDRTIQYRLVSEESLVLASRMYTQTGYMLKLVPPGTFSMGSERREQGHRPNEGFRRVTLKRPVYFGVTEVTNEQFRRFKPDHRSGAIGRHSLDLDDLPVTQVSWNEAAEYCNWLSGWDNLPPAYEKRNDEYFLKRPVGIGYRLPTEAEWEYAARYSAPGEFRKYAWGDTLPVSSDVGNIAGAETGNSLPASLPGYRDNYPDLAPVGKFEASPLGLQDMSGNVSEWIGDYYFSYVDSAPVTDPLGAEDGTRHVIRGANWKTAAAADLRLATRDGADDASNTIGFRVVRYAE